MSLLYGESCTVTATVMEFSLVPPGEMKADIEYCDSGGGNFRDVYQIAVFPNGCEASMKGFISIHFRRWPYLESVMRRLKGEFQGTHLDAIENKTELICIISVVDVEGLRRFPQTFVFCHDLSVRQTRFRIDNYLSYSVLLNESSELLPEDTLTLHMDIIFRKTDIKHLSDDSLLQLASSSFEMGSDADGELFRSLSLDSPLAVLLHQESPVFQCMMETPMVERSSRRMRMTDDGEYLSFISIGRILWGDPLLSFNSLNDILTLYATADKYGIAAALKIITRWLVLCLSRDTVSKISALADTYGDDYLRKAVKDFLDSEENADSKGGTQSPATNRDDEWTFHNVENGVSVGLHFRRGFDDGGDNERDKFDFYT